MRLQECIYAFVRAGVAPQGDSHHPDTWIATWRPFAKRRATSRNSMTSCWRRAGCATQFGVLSRLRRDGPMTINELAAELVMDRARRWAATSCHSSATGSSKSPSTTDRRRHGCALPRRALHARVAVEALDGSAAAVQRCAGRRARGRPLPCARGDIQRFRGREIRISLFGPEVPVPTGKREAPSGSRRKSLIQSGLSADKTPAPPPAGLTRTEVNVLD